MKTAVILLLCAATSFAKPVKRAAGDQKPGVWDALAQNSGKGKLSIDDARDLYINAKAGQDYPNLSEIPAGNFDCVSVKPGFYADVDNKCQVIRRCDINGNQTAYLCPNMTIFNQITLVCDWFYNVDCSQAKKWYDYSNSRLYQGADVPLLDNQDQIAEDLGAVKPTQAGRVLIPSSKPSKPAPAKPAPAKPAPAAKATTAAPAEEVSTAAPASEETPAPAGGEDTTAAAADASPAAAASAEETTAAAAGGEASAAPAAAEDTTAAAGGEASAAPAAAEETTAAAAGGGAEETTVAAGEATSAAAAGGEETTAAAAGGEEATTAAAAAGGEESTAAAAE